MASKAITQQKVNDFNNKFQPELAEKYRAIHDTKCHHWDFSFLLWHRKLVNEFWSDIALERFYFIPFVPGHIPLYQDLKSTIRMQGEKFVYVKKAQKLQNYSEERSKRVARELQQAIYCDTFDLDLDHTGSNRSQNRLYNISFSSQLEEAHDLVHGYTGAGMSNIRTAGGDACFFIHHTFIDLAFEFWLQKKLKSLPFTEEHFNASPSLKNDFNSFDEIKKLWEARYYTQVDYQHFEELYNRGRATNTLIKFDRIEHRQEMRLVRMENRTGTTIGEFAIFTGSIETCAHCKDIQSHTCCFSLTEVIQLTSIVWFIAIDQDHNSSNPVWTRYDRFEEARDALGNMGISPPYIIIFE